MNDLVKRLSGRIHPIQVNRPQTDTTALLERIRLKYLHVLFVETGTEIGIQLDEKSCDFSKSDFKNSSGLAHCEGVMTLNYDKVRCIIDFDLATMLGEGRLSTAETESNYNAIIKSKEKVAVLNDLL